MMSISCAGDEGIGEQKLKIGITASLLDGDRGASVLDRNPKKQGHVCIPPKGYGKDLGAKIRVCSSDIPRDIFSVGFACSCLPVRKNDDGRDEIVIAFISDILNSLCAVNRIKKRSFKVRPSHRLQALNKCNCICLGKAGCLCRSPALFGATIREGMEGEVILFGQGWDDGPKGAFGVIQFLTRHGAAHIDGKDKILGQNIGQIADGLNMCDMHFPEPTTMPPVGIISGS